MGWFAPKSLKQDNGANKSAERQARNLQEQKADAASDRARTEIMGKIRTEVDASATKLPPAFVEVQESTAASRLPLEPGSEVWAVWAGDARWYRAQIKSLGSSKTPGPSVEVAWLRAPSGGAGVSALVADGGPEHVSDAGGDDSTFTFVNWASVTSAAGPRPSSGMPGMGPPVSGISIHSGSGTVEWWSRESEEVDGYLQSMHDLHKGTAQDWKLHYDTTADPDIRVQQQKESWFAEVVRSGACCAAEPCGNCPKDCKESCRAPYVAKEAELKHMQHMPSEACTKQSAQPWTSPWGKCVPHCRRSISAGDEAEFLTEFGLAA
eukprot:gnl/TRDRNA2_/TRDRNA2_168826_c1_seq4.p1 gnl/TRDRNA2_/TRDRNA2_168826_c1~~gnl/TRDRNA2_/TRDRNA2_168826_c1_seq4.p1  ORF type:complete len:322 (+),score=64.05 gnl/TRDRNA2_/TRDRNA2_168826_c1_seq4:35-1000(+)